MIDLHILTIPSRQDVFERALASIPPGLFNIHIVNATTGLSIGEERLKAYSVGSAEYCTFLNDDDELMGEGAAQTVEELYRNTKAVGVFSDELVVDDFTGNVRSGRSTGTGPWDPFEMFRFARYGHQLLIMKRSVIKKHMPVASLHGTLSEYVLRCLAMWEGDWVHAPFDAYKWHLHGGNSHKHVSGRQRLEASKFVLPVLQRLNYLPGVKNGTAPSTIY